MIPIHELLNRIRWDPEFAKGNFQLGYYDRAEDRIILISLKGKSTAFRFTGFGKFTRTPNAFGIGKSRMGSVWKEAAGDHTSTINPGSKPCRDSVG